MRENTSALDGRCSEDGCGKAAFRRGLCMVHYRDALPRCQVKGCMRPAVSQKMCWPHRKLWGGPVQTRPKRTSTDETRVLAWGRLYLAADAVKAVEEEARRRGGSPSGLLAEIVEHWAREVGHNHDVEADEPAEMNGRPAAAGAGSAAR